MARTTRKKPIIGVGDLETDAMDFKTRGREKPAPVTQDALIPNQPGSATPVPVQGGLPVDITQRKPVLTDDINVTGVADAEPTLLENGQVPPGPKPPDADAAPVLGDVPTFDVPLRPDLPEIETPTREAPAQIEAPPGIEPGKFDTPTIGAVDPLARTERPDLPLFETPGQQDLPTLADPEFDTAAVSKRAQEIAAPDIRRLRNAVQAAIAQGDRNPNVRRMTLRSALEGFGIGLGDIASKARTKANEEITQQAQIKSEQAKTVFAAKTTQIRDKFAADISTGQFNAEATINSLNQEWTNATRANELEYTTEVQLIRDQFSAELAAEGAEFEAGESAKSLEYQGKLRVAEANLNAKNAAVSDQFKADVQTARDMFTAATRAQEQDIQSKITGSAATFNAQFEATLATFDRAYDKFIISGQQEFQAGEAAIGREFVTGERVGGQEFAATETALNRALTTSERTAIQAFQTNERFGAQAFRTGERLSSQDFASLEKSLDRTFSAGEREAIQAFQTSERTGAQEFRAGERISSQDFSSAERALDRTFSADERNAIQAFQTSERVGAQAFRTGERISAQDWTSIETELGRTFSTEERDAIQAFQTSERVSGQEFRTEESEKSREFVEKIEVRNEKINTITSEISSLEDQLLILQAKTFEPKATAIPGQFAKSAAEANNDIAIRNAKAELDGLRKELDEENDAQEKERKDLKKEREETPAPTPAPVKSEPGRTVVDFIQEQEQTATTEGIVTTRERPPDAEVSAEKPVKIAPLGKTTRSKRGGAVQTDQEVVGKSDAFKFDAQGNTTQVRMSPLSDFITVKKNPNAIPGSDQARLGDNSGFLKYNDQGDLIGYRWNKKSFGGKWFDPRVSNGLTLSDLGGFKDASSFLLPKHELLFTPEENHQLQGEIDRRKLVTQEHTLKADIENKERFGKAEKGSTQAAFKQAQEDYIEKYGTKYEDAEHRFQTNAQKKRGY